MYNSEVMEEEDSIIRLIPVSVKRKIMSWKMMAKPWMKITATIF
jgi:hypothetical protein